MRRAPLVVLGLLAAAAAACSGSSPSWSPPQPEAPPGDWSCLNPLALASPLTAVQPPRGFAVSLEDAATHAPVGDLRLAVCARNDQDCASPISRATADGSGHATLSAPEGPSTYDGFVRVSGPGVATHHFFLPGRVAACDSCALALPLYTPSALEAIAGTTKLSLDARGGMVRTDLEDCAGTAAPGVSVSIGSFGCSELGATTKGAARSGFVTPEECAAPAVAYATGGYGNGFTRAALATDATGVALGFGVPPGQLGIAEVLDGKTVAGALGFTRGGAVSEFVLRP